MSLPPLPPPRSSSAIALPLPPWITGYGVTGDDASRHLIARLRPQCIRTWGTDQLTDPLLADCSAMGTRVWAGLWLQAAATSRDEAAALARTVADEVARFKTCTAIQAWVVGNEVELRSRDAEAAHATVRECIAAVRAADPTRLVATAISDHMGMAVMWQRETCAACRPDVLLVNAYGGAPTLAARLASAASSCDGRQLPFALGEFGCRGPWECADEPSSAEAAAWAHASFIANRHDPLFRGGFAFLGGFKVERSPTWFSLALPRTLAPDAAAGSGSRPLLWALAADRIAATEAAWATPPIPWRPPIAIAITEAALAEGGVARLHITATASVAATVPCRVIAIPWSIWTAAGTLAAALAGAAVAIADVTLPMAPAPPPSPFIVDLRLPAPTTTAHLPDDMAVVAVAAMPGDGDVRLITACARMRTRGPR